MHTRATNARTGCPRPTRIQPWTTDLFLLATECRFFLAFAWRKNNANVRRPRSTSRPTRPWPTSSRNTTGTALTISHLKRGEGGKERGGRRRETDQMDLERMKNWFCQPNELDAPPAFEWQASRQAGLCDCNVRLARLSGDNVPAPRSALSVKIN